VGLGWWWDEVVVFESIGEVRVFPGDAHPTCHDRAAVGDAYEQHGMASSAKMLTETNGTLLATTRHQQPS
jgi:hypothetical protein